MSEKVLCTSSVLEWKWEIRVKECAQRGLVCTICIWNVNQDLDYYFKIRVKECAQRGLSILFALAFVFVCTICTCISNVNQDLDYYFFQVPMDKSEEMVKNQKSSLAKSKFILCKDHQGLLKSFPLSLSLFETEERLVGTEPWPSMFRLAMHHDFDSAYISADNVVFPPKNNYFRLLLLSYHRHNPAGCAIFVSSADLQCIFGLGNAYAIRLAHYDFDYLHCCGQRWVRCKVGYVHLQLWWFSQTAGRPQASCSNVYRPCTKENRGRELDVIKIA